MDKPNENDAKLIADIENIKLVIAMIAGIYISNRFSPFFSISAYAKITYRYSHHILYSTFVRESH